jgi:hypothetical protein
MNVETGLPVSFKYTTCENPLQAFGSRTACQNAVDVVEVSAKRPPKSSSEAVPDQLEVFAEKLFASAILHLSYAIPSKGEMTTFRLHAFFCLSLDDICRQMILSSHRDTVVHEQVVEAAFSMLRRPRSESRAILAIVRARLWRTWNEPRIVYLAECA